MTTPHAVADNSEMGWISVDDMVWLTDNVLDAAVGPAAVLACHNDPRTGEQCADGFRHIGLHTIVSREPLAIVASLRCDVCPWHGWVTDGHWVPA